MIAIIALGYFLKKGNVIGAQDSRMFSKMVSKITMPGLIISTLNGVHVLPVMLLMVLAGIAVDFLMMGTVGFFHKNDTNEDRALAMVNCSSVSLGSFAIPFLQSTLAPGQLALIMLYDVGNGIMAFPGTYTVGHLMLRHDEPGVWKSARKKLLSAPTMWFYLIMTLLGTMRIALPEGIVLTAEIIADANAMLSMLIIGSTLEFKRHILLSKQLFKMLSVHYGTVVVFLIVVFFLLPVGTELRVMLAMILLSPLAIGGLANTQLLGMNEEVAGVLNSVTVIIGILAIMILAPLMC